MAKVGRKVLCQYVQSSLSDLFFQGWVRFYQVHTLYRDANETKSWMNEKETALLSDDCGRDLASVQALQRKHEGLERELAALEDKVEDLGEEARRLQGEHPDSADRIAAKQAEIVELWETIKRKVRAILQPCNSK